MKKVKNRAIAVVILALALVAGLSFYIVRLTISGEKWASSRVNQGVYSGNSLAVGTITDRNGVVLAEIIDGLRTYSPEKALRTATLHAVGDKSNNIGTAALIKNAGDLIGYSFLNGTYSLDGGGGTLELSIDSDLNLAAYDALSGRHGAVIVLDYMTGEVLCMVSTPSFDPENASAYDLDSPAYEGVYLNRAISAAYTPGSVFKLVTAAAALERIPDIETRMFTCTGAFTVGEGVVTCPSAHGTLDFKDALAHSCNIAFATLALELGADALCEYAQGFGLLSKLEIDGIATAAGNYALAEDGSFDLAWSGAGQSKNLASPVSMARLAAAIANGGSAPELTLKKRGFSLRGVKTDRIMSAGTAQGLREMMSYNVEESYGVSNYPGLLLCAKSGTAEVGSGLQPHAWFVGFIENEDYPLAFAVIVENGGWGRAVAGEVANIVLQEAIK